MSKLIENEFETQIETLTKNFKVCENERDKLRNELLEIKVNL